MKQVTFFAALVMMSASLLSVCSCQKESVLIEKTTATPSAAAQRAKQLNTTAIPTANAVFGNPNSGANLPPWGWEYSGISYFTRHHIQWDCRYAPYAFCELVTRMVRPLDHPDAIMAYLNEDKNHVAVKFALTDAHLAVEIFAITDEMQAEIANLSEEDRNHFTIAGDLTLPTEISRSLGAEEVTMRAGIYPIEFSDEYPLGRIMVPIVR
jgi:hypothetical protein